MYMDYNKIFAKNEKELETFIQSIRIYNKDITMKWKREITEEIELPNQENIRKLGEKRKLQIHGNIHIYQPHHSGRT